MGQYYYLVSGLPELVPESLPKQLNHLDLKREVLDQLSQKDKLWVEQLYWPMDHAKLLPLVQQYLSVKDKRDFFTQDDFEEADILGNYTLQELKHAFKELEGLPDYMLQFIEQILQDEKSNLLGINAIENELLQRFYAQVQTSANAFIRDYFTFEAGLRNLMLAHTVRKLQRQDFHAFFVGEGELVQLLKKNTSADFGVKGLIEYADELFQILESENWMEREHKLDLMKWKYVDQLNQFNYFSIDVVLGFLLKLQWADRWMQWDPITGQTMLNQLSEQVGDSFNLELLTQ